MRPDPEGRSCEGGGGSAVEAALVASARAGSAAAFSALVQRHQQAVRAFARRLGGDLAEADDLAQEAFVTAWSGLARFDGRSSFRAWVCGVVYRKALTARRGAVRRLGRDGAYALERDRAGGDGAGTPSGEAARLATHTALQRAMGALPVDQRAAVALCLAADFSHAEAAEALNLPLGTVKSHVNRGRARLLELMGGRDD
jgi:RNA polymerase sigma-70 factor, ECF subfamily